MLVAIGSPFCWAGLNAGNDCTHVTLQQEQWMQAFYDACIIDQAISTYLETNKHFPFCHHY